MNVWLDRIAHVLLGAVFVLSSLVVLFGLAPKPELSGAAGAFTAGMGATGYFIPVLKVVELVGGSLLLIRRFVPLALVLLAPVVVQIFLYHAFLAPTGLPIAVLLVALEAYLGFVVYRSSFGGVLKAKP